MRGRAFAFSDGQMENQKNIRKRKRIEFCLAEGIRMRHREFIKMDVTMSVCADSRQSRLLMRFSCANAKGEDRKGVLGMERDYGSGHAALMRAKKNHNQKVLLLGFLSAEPFFEIQSRQT